MNYWTRLAVLVSLLGFWTGCSSVRSVSPDAATSPTSDPMPVQSLAPNSIAPTPTMDPSIDPSIDRSIDQATDPSSTPDAETPDVEPPTETTALQQDYASSQPIAATGQVTQRYGIQALDPAQLIADCPTDSAPYAFAESTNYRVQICSQEFDPWLPKYYIGQAKDGSGDLRITSANPDEARQLIFKAEGYTYVLYRDSARPEQNNAYLEVYTPNGDGYAEALWRLYEVSPPR